MDQERIMQLQMVEQEVNQLSQQSQLIEQHISEMQELKLGLIEIEKSENQEILVNLGKRIYIPVEIKDRELIVEVGNKTFVKKSIADTNQLVDEQMEKLVLAKYQITERLGELDSQMDLLIRENPEKESLGKGSEEINEDGCGQEHGKHSCEGKCEPDGKECKHEDCKCEEDCGDECKCH
jgi:prefoldin alpha subunit